VTGKVTLVWRSDLHLADHAPCSRVDDWSETLLGKLEQVGRIAKRVGAAAVLDGGDFYHVKSPSRNSHRAVQRVAQIHGEYPCPTYANVGNHDCKYGDLRFLHEQPLGVLFESGVFKRCYGEDEAVFEVHHPGPLGYEEPTLRVRVVGIPYHGTEYDLERFTSIEKGDEDFLVVMAHVLASPEGGTMFEGEDIIKYADLAGLAPDVWLFGHWHKNQGIVEFAPGKWAVNLGALSRGALTQDDLTRAPSVAVLTFHYKNGLSIEERPLKVEPSEAVFDLEGRMRQEARDMTMEAFVDNFRKTLLDTEAKPLLDTILDLPDTPQEIKERAVLYLEQQG